MKANGTPVEDLAGTGLSTRQRWVIPIWVSVLTLAGGLAFRYGARASVWAVRARRGTVPAAVLALVDIRYGYEVSAVVLASAGIALLIWRWRWPASFARHVSMPARGAWRWRTRYQRRWHPAMDGTGLTRMTPDRKIYVPRVTGVRSTAVVDTLHVRLLHGHTPTGVASHAEELRHVYAAHRCTVVEDGPGRIRILFYARDPLTRVVPPISPAAVPDLAGLLVGLAEDGTGYRLGLLGRHVLVAGASGAGKGSVLWSIVRALGPGIASGVVRLRGLDPKGGMELYPGRALFTDYADEDAGALVAVLERAVEDMNGRKRRLKDAGVRAFVPSRADPLEVVVVDELAFLTAYADKGTKLKVAAALQLLLSQGRAVGFSVVACLQDPRKDVLPFRDLFTYRIAPRLTEDSHVDMVLGDGALERGAACHLIPMNLPAVGFVHVDGAAEPVRVRFSYLADGDISDMAERWPAPGNETTADVIDLREPGPRLSLPAPRTPPAIESYPTDHTEDQS